MAAVSDADSDLAVGTAGEAAGVGVVVGDGAGAGVLALAGVVRGGAGDIPIIRTGG
jgi:hypothetical protein